MPLILGGQQGISFTKRMKMPLGMPISHVSGSSLLLRWTLLSPAVFPNTKENEAKGIKAHSGGWLPNWVDAETGQVMLPCASAPDRSTFKTRDEWRKAVAAMPKFKAKLVAARIGKPAAFSGWDMQTGPKPTFLAVPAGSTYVFECESQDERDRLSQALSWHGMDACETKNRRSTLFGAQGYGIGVCSTFPSNQQTH